MSFRVRVLAMFVVLALAPLGFAQYMPGPSPTPGSPTPGATSTSSPGYVPPAHGYKANPALIGGLVGGGAAAAGGIWYYMHHRNLMQGCVGPDGKTLIREKDGQRFQLLGTTLQPGERVTLKAKKDDSDASGSSLQVEDVRKDSGRCEQSAQVH